MASEQTPRINPGFDGMDAKRNGLPVEACPYEPGPQRMAWVVGWYIVKNEDAREVHGKATP